MKYEVEDSSIIERVRTIITEAQAKAVRAVDYQRVLMYWNIGREIFKEFLLEIGNGFAFVARQQRIHLDGDDFFADLVFYNRLLRCFVIVELKTHKLTHQDLGQLHLFAGRAG